MLIRASSATITARVLVAIPFLLLLVSCGKNVNSTQGATPSQQTTPSSVPQSRPIHSTTFDVANIHFYSGEGIVCLNYSTFNTNKPTGLHANLVLATNRLTYDTAELQQMEAYATALDGMTSQYPTPAPQAPPSMLSWIPGTIVGDVDMRTLIGAGCFGEMELTNTGKNSILIRSINMQLTAKPVRTSPSFQYRMINLCSLLTGDERNSCPPQAAGSGPLFEFFRLKAAPSGTVFTPKQEINDSEYQSGSDIVLHPNDPYALPVLFYFMSLDNLVYSLTPELLLDTPNGAQQAVALPQLATTLYFANPSQFSCYTLQGDTFVKGSMDRYSSTAYCV